MSKFKFFYSTASASTSAHLALIEAGIPFEGVEISWDRELNLEPLLKANWLEAVPTILFPDGKTLTQNVSILEYIADQAPEKKLLPAVGSFERREALNWMVFASADFQRSFLAIGSAEGVTSNKEAQAEIEKAALARVHEYLEYIELSLKGKNYLVGNDYTLADAHLYCCLNWCEWSEIPFATYPNIVAYRERVLKRPAVLQVMSAEGLI